MESPEERKTRLQRQVALMNEARRRKREAENEEAEGFSSIQEFAYRLAACDAEILDSFMKDFRKAKGELRLKYYKFYLETRSKYDMDEY